MRLGRSIVELLLHACENIPFFYQQDCAANLARYETEARERYAIHTSTLGVKNTRESTLTLNLIRVQTAAQIIVDCAPHVASYESLHSAWNISAGEPVTLRAQVYESLGNWAENSALDASERQIGYELMLMHRNEIVGTVSVLLKKNTERNHKLFKRLKEGLEVDAKGNSTQRPVIVVVDGDDTDTDESLFGSDDSDEPLFASEDGDDFDFFASLPSRTASPSKMQQVSRVDSWSIQDDTSEDVGYIVPSRVYHSLDSTHSFVIQNVWNLVPGQLSNVGVALMHEAVNSLIRENKHITLQRQQKKKSHFKLAIKKIKSTFKSLHRRALIPAPIKTDTSFWEHKTRTSPITLDSVFESLTFYTQLGFQLIDPQLLIPADPQFPDILEDLTAIANQDYTLIKDSFLHQLRTNHDENATNNTVGIIERFRTGKPTEHDWWEFVSWRDATTEMSDLNNERLDYEEFVARYPNSTDYLDKKWWEASAGAVLVDEMERFLETGVKRVGYHMAIPMVLSVKNRFFRDVVGSGIRRNGSSRESVMD